MWDICHVSVGHLHAFLWEMSLGPLPLFQSGIYFLAIVLFESLVCFENKLLVTCMVCKCFYPPMCSLFIVSSLLVLSLSGKNFSLTQFHLSTFAFVSCAFFIGGEWGVQIKKSLARPMSKNFPCFSSSFMVSGLMLKFLVHFELIFYTWCEMTVWFHSLVDIQAFPILFTQDVIHPPWCILGIFIEINWS